MPGIRRRIFVGCEGKGERSLVVVLQRFAEQLECPVHLDPFDAHGGDPRTIVAKSIRESRSRATKKGFYDGGRFILVDTDRIDEEVIRLAEAEGLNLIQQIDCLECHLGRIISGKHGVGAVNARKELAKAWPDYRKGFDAMTLKDKITLENLKASKEISPDWALLLQTIGIVLPE